MCSGSSQPPVYPESVPPTGEETSISPSPWGANAPDPATTGRTGESMSRDWEKQFGQWAKGPGTTEEKRCENAVSAIRNAINESPQLKHRNTKVFVQGS